MILSTIIMVFTVKCYKGCKMFKQSGSNRGCSYLTAIIFILLLSHSAFSQSSPLSSKGGVDTHVYKTDTVIFEATAMDDASPTLSEGVSSVGLSMFHSPYMSTFYIPLKYGLNDIFQISFSLPFITKTYVYNNTHYIKSAYGDTMLGLTAFTDPLDFLSSITTVRLTLPTGDVNAQDGGVYIPMGYGNYTVSLQESVSFDEFHKGFASIRFFLSGLGVYYFKSTTDIDTSTKYSYDKTYIWSLTAGADFGVIENLDLELKLNYIDIKERKYKVESSYSATGGWINADDSVKQFNILPFIKYNFPNEITAQVGIIYPIKTLQDKTLTTTYDAQWKIAMGIEKRFGDSTSDISGDNTKKSAEKYKRKTRKRG